MPTRCKKCYFKCHRIYSYRDHSNSFKSCFYAAMFFYPRNELIDVALFLLFLLSVNTNKDIYLCSNHPPALYSPVHTSSPQSSYDSHSAWKNNHVKKGSNGTAQSTRIHSSRAPCAEKSTYSVVWAACWSEQYLWFISFRQWMLLEVVMEEWVLFGKVCEMAPFP